MKAESERNQIVHECQRIYTKYFSASASIRISFPEGLIAELKDALKASFSKTRYDPFEDHLRKTKLESMWSTYVISPIFESAIRQIIVDFAAAAKKDKT
jgi:hypothetical protein